MRVNRQRGWIMLLVYLALIAVALGTMYAAWSAFTGKYVDEGIAQATAELQPKIDAAIKERDATMMQVEQAFAEIRRLLGVNEEMGKRFDALAAANDRAFADLDRRTRESSERARVAIVRAQASAARYEQDMTKLQAQARQRVTTPNAEQWPEAEILLRAAAARRALNLPEPQPEAQPRLRLSP